MKARCLTLDQKRPAEFRYWVDINLTRSSADYPSCDEAAESGGLVLEVEGSLSPAPAGPPSVSKIDI